MAKSRRTISTVLPNYERDRHQWRKNILTNVLNVARETGIRYGPEDKFEVVVLLYLSKGKRYAIHDVDNRLKDILDALQGRFGSVRTKTRLIENDNQICRVLIEKQPIPKMFGDDAGGKFRTKHGGGPCRRPRAIIWLRGRRESPIDLPFTGSFLHLVILTNSFAVDTVSL